MDKKYFIGGIALLAILFYVITSGSGEVQIPTANKVLGNISSADAMQSTTTSSSWDTFAAAKTFKLLCSTPGVLGSVIINNETAGSFNIYDGTTTSSHTMHATTTLANINASLAENAYPFNSVANIGLIVEFQSSNVASSTITYRCS